MASPRKGLKYGKRECKTCGRTIGFSGSKKWPDQLMPHADQEGFPCPEGEKPENPLEGTPGEHKPRGTCRFCQRSIAKAGSLKDPDQLMPHTRSDGMPCLGGKRAKKKPTFATGDMF